LSRDNDRRHRQQTQDGDHKTEHPYTLVPVEGPPSGSCGLP
jgi:hypothetical protein